MWLSLVEELKTDITNDVEISLEKQKTEIQVALDKKLKKTYRYPHKKKVLD